MSKCIYCLKSMDPEEVTKDHVFPKSWYTSDTPNSVQRWTVPSCQKCNHELKLVEEEVFLGWALSMNPGDQTAAGIPEKIVEMIRYDSTKKDKVNRIRLATLMKIIKRMTKYDPSRTLKGVGPKEGVRGTTAITTPSASRDALATKIIKGLEFKIRCKYIEEPRKVRIYFPLDKDPLSDHYTTWEKLIEPTKQTMQLGTSFIAKYGINPGYDQAIYHIRIWNHYEFWAWVFKEDQG